MDCIIFPNKIVASEHTTILRNIGKSQKKFYLDFVNKLVKIYKKTNKERVMIGLCGPVGSGKTVLAVLTEQLARQLDLPFHIQHLSQDGYHYPNSYLLSHKKNGRTFKDFKGKYYTYDALKLKKDLKQFKDGKKITFPGYSRKTHNPFKNGIQVSEKRVLLIVEGIWLLYNKNNWKGIANFFDYSFYIKADKKKVRAKVIERLHRGGKTIKAAKWHYDNSDAISFDLIEKSSVNADEILKPYYEIK